MAIKSFYSVSGESRVTDKHTDRLTDTHIEPIARISYIQCSLKINVVAQRKLPKTNLIIARGVEVYYNPLGNLNSGRSGPWTKLIRSASLQLVFDAAISKLLWRLVSRCFYTSICIFSTIRLKWLVQFECVVMWQNVYRQSPDGDREMFLSIMLAVCRILDKLHSFSNILCTCSIFIRMWAHVTAYLLFIYRKHPNKVFFTIIYGKHQYFLYRFKLITYYFRDNEN